MSEHEHNHSQPITSSRIYYLSTAINIFFIIFEIFMGRTLNSVALVSDAFHNLGDVLGIVIAFVGMTLATRRPTTEHTYGLRNTTILAAFLNALIMAGTVVILVVEVIQSFIHPEKHLDGIAISLVALLGIIVNGATAYLFMRNSKQDVNEKSVFVHFLSDTLISVAVVVAGILIKFTGWTFIDPLISILSILAIAKLTWGLLIETWNLITNGVPENINEPEVVEFLESLPNVSKINDLHIWGISTTESALSAHLQCSKIDPEMTIIDQATKGLRDKFKIEHVTIQLDAPKHTHSESSI
jgi:cobalt-zinc-cadmium efflux system protein